MTLPLAFLASLRSVRHFTDRPVSREQIDQILDVARWTGSARNRQPWRFHVVRDKAVQQRLSRLGQYAGHLAVAPVVLVLLSADDGRLDTPFDLGRVAQTISLAAHAAGLGSCLATLYPNDNAAEASRILDLAPGWLPHHAMSVGYPATAQPPPPTAIPAGRLALTALVTRQEFGRLPFLLGLPESAGGGSP
jgi:nitroreductase